VKRDQSIELLDSAVKVWAFLKQQGGLDEDYYDKAILIELRSRLFLPEDCDLDIELRNRQITTENFLLAFFEAVQPYAEMMSDLLAMFQSAGAKETDHNLAVEFDFGSDSPALKFDLNHFRDYLHVWEKQKGHYLQMNLNSKSLWDLFSIFKDVSWNASVLNPEFQIWYSEYKKERWPTQPLRPPISRDIRLDEVLSKVWQIWSGFVNACKLYGSERRNVVDAYYNRPKDEQKRENTSAESSGWALDVIGPTESDRWAGSFAHKVYYSAETIVRKPPEMRQAMANDLRLSLEAVLSQFPRQEILTETLVDRLKEFLNLPIWQRRHELYSAWVSTQILNAIPSKSLRIHTVGKKLVFAFSGTHLATFDAYTPRLHVWAELRSPLEHPIGKHRTGAIQPDYSLITDPVSNPEASILEVECKQYRKPSVSNFSAALTDYAQGRPNAQVVLVNYGAVDQEHLARVNETVRDRTFLVGNMRPGSPEAQERFKQLVQGAVQKRFARFLSPDSFMISLEKNAKVVLAWQTEPRDLDLHLHLTLPNKVYDINFSDIGSLSNPPWAQLEKDIRDSAEPEVIRVSQWEKGKYQFAVHNYSKERILTGCGAKLTFVYGEEEITYQCPQEGTGEWWLAFEIDGRTGEVNVVNKIAEVPW
jgi:uncharacterized protein YfaP (DUF2135 family)